MQYADYMYILRVGIDSYTWSRLAKEFKNQCLTNPFRFSQTYAEYFQVKRIRRHMTDSQLALVFSVVSIGIAATSLGWNIYRGVLLKPRLHVSFDKKHILFHMQEPLGPYIGVTVTNHGPGEVRLNTIPLRRSSMVRKIFKAEEYAILTHGKPLVF